MSPDFVSAYFPCFAFDVSCLRTDKSEHRVLFHINFHIKHALKWLFAPFSPQKKQPRSAMPEVAFNFKQKNMQTDMEMLKAQLDIMLVLYHSPPARTARWGF